MARPFTTFSVVDILGPSAPNDAGQLSRPALPSPYLCAPQQPQAYYATHAAIALSHRPGVVNQMLPPVPANNLSPCRAATTASSYSSPTHSPQRPCARSPQRGNNMEKRSQNKRGRKEKRLTPSRVSDEADVSLKPLAENEDDVFLPNFSRRNPARNCQSARDLNSAGDTPSPPGTSANISNDAAPPSPPEESGSTTIATVGDLMTTDMTETDETPGVCVCVCVCVYVCVWCVCVCQCVSVLSLIPLTEDEDLPKKKRTRTAYSRDQIHTMERHFRKSAYPDNQLLKIIRRETGIEVPKLQVCVCVCATFFKGVNDCTRSFVSRCGSRIGEPRHASGVRRFQSPATILLFIVASLPASSSHNISLPPLRTQPPPLNTSPLHSTLLPSHTSPPPPPPSSHPPPITSHQPTHFTAATHCGSCPLNPSPTPSPTPSSQGDPQFLPRSLPTRLLYSPPTTSQDVTSPHMSTGLNSSTSSENLLAYITTIKMLSRVISVYIIVLNIIIVTYFCFILNFASYY